MLNNKEIGGYFELEHNCGKEYYSDLIALNTARNALVYVVRAKKYRKVYIPSFLCASVSGVLDRENISYNYYGVDKNFMPIFQDEMDEDEVMYIVNYYGILDDNTIYMLQHKYKRIVIDNTHAFFRKPLKDVDTIYSCRKFFGVPDGAYLSTNVYVDYSLQTDVSYRRMEHILGRYEKSADEFYDAFKAIDESFKTLPLMHMSKLTHNLLKTISYSDCKRIRTENFALYARELGKQNKINISKMEGAFAYPLYVASAQKLRRNLIEEKIYIPLLWPDVADKCCEFDISEEYSQNILPLPCDQRVTRQDINKIINIINSNV